MMEEEARIGLVENNDQLSGSEVAEAERYDGKSCVHVFAHAQTQNPCPWGYISYDLVIKLCRKKNDKSSDLVV